MTTNGNLNQIAGDLQKAILNNYRLLNVYGMSSTPEVMCSCSILNPGGVIKSDTTMGPSAQPSAPPKIIPSQFVPGGNSTNRQLLPVDVGNTPFILPEGITPESIMLAQEEGIRPLQEEAEKKAAAAAAASGATTVVTESVPGATAVAISVPASNAGGTVAPTITTSENNGSMTIATPAVATTTTSVGGVQTTISKIPGIETFAPFRYGLDSMVTPYHERLMIDPVASGSRMCRENYIQGATEVLGMSLFSWCVFFGIIAPLMIYFFSTTT